MQIYLYNWGTHNHRENYHISSWKENHSQRIIWDESETNIIDLSWWLNELNRFYFFCSWSKFWMKDAAFIFLFPSARYFLGSPFWSRFWMKEAAFWFVFLSARSMFPKSSFSLLSTLISILSVDELVKCCCNKGCSKSRFTNLNIVI